MLLPGLAFGCVARTRALVPCVWSRHITLGHALPGDATHYRWYGRLEPKNRRVHKVTTHSTSTHKKQLRVLFDSEVFLIGISHEILQIRECQFVNSIYMIVCEIRIDSIDRCIRSIYSNRCIRSIYSIDIDNSDQYVRYTRKWPNRHCMPHITLFVRRRVRGPRAGPPQFEALGNQWPLWGHRGRCNPPRVESRVRMFSGFGT